MWIGKGKTVYSSSKVDPGPDAQPLSPWSLLLCTEWQLLPLNTCYASILHTETMDSTDLPQCSGLGLFRATMGATSPGAKFPFLYPSSSVSAQGTMELLQCRKPYGISVEQ